MATLKEKTKELEELIQSQTDSMGTPISVGLENDVPELEPTPIIEIKHPNIRNTAKSRASQTITTIISHILPKEYHKETYIVDKKKQDIETLTTLYIQQEYITIMIKANVDAVATSGGSPRMFETFSGLEKTMMDLNKQILATETVLRSTYNSLKTEIDYRKRQEAQLLQQSSDDEQQLLTTSKSQNPNDSGMGSRMKGTYKFIKQAHINKKKDALDTLMEIGYDEPEETVDAVFEEI